MIDMPSMYDNMHKNGMFYALICINNHVIINLNCISSSTLGYGTSGNVLKDTSEVKSDK